MKDNTRENIRRRKARAASLKWYHANKEKARAANLKWYHANKEKRKEKAREWQRNNPDKVLKATLKWQRANPEKTRAIKQRYRAANRERLKGMKRGWDLAGYGLTVEEYDAMLTAQDGGCAICKRPPTGSRRLHVDHCHDSKKVRGLLCNSCNNGLGRFRDDPQLLRAAASYLEA